MDKQRKMQRLAEIRNRLSFFPYHRRLQPFSVRFDAAGCVGHAGSIRFSDKKIPEPKLRDFPMLFLHGGPVRQLIGDHINDRLRRIFAANTEDFGSDAKTNMNHHTLPLS